jgi:hypothetical protein
MHKKMMLAFCCLFFIAANTLKAQDAKKIIEKHIKAIGGYKKVTSQQAVHIQGEIIAGGITTGTITMWQISNKGFRADMKRGDTVRSQVTYDGYRWSESNPGKKGKPVKISEAALKNMDLSLGGEIADYKSDSIKLTYSGMDTVDGKPCYKILLTNKGNRTTYYYFDTKTYYILQSKVVKIENGKETDMGTSRFGDHRKTPFGLVRPYLLMQVVNGKVVSSTKILLIDEVVEESVFKMPPQSDN